MATINTIVKFLIQDGTKLKTINTGYLVDICNTTDDSTTIENGFLNSGMSNLTGWYNNLISQIVTNPPKIITYKRQTYVAPAAPVASNITGTTITVTSEAGSTIKYLDVDYTSPHTFTGLTNGTSYTFYAYIPTVTGIVQSPNSISLVTKAQVLVYNGKVNNIITGANLFTSTGVSEGTTAISGDITWLKFIYNGKTLLVANNCIKNNITWDQLNSHSAVFGKTINISGVYYKIRLLTGGDSNPTATSVGGEWKNLIIKYTPLNTDSYWNTVYTLVQESLTGSSTYRITVGGPTIDNFGYVPSNYPLSYIGWRPVLEVI